MTTPANALGIDDARESRARWTWMSLIIAVFALQGSVWIAAIIYTARDPSDAVIHRYDQRALQWNEFAAAQRASRQLAWSCQIEIPAELDPLRRRTVNVVLRDRQDIPISGAKVQIDAFHRARAGQRFSAVLTEVEAGHYRALLPLTRAGMYCIEIDVRRGNDRFFADYVVEAPPTVR